MGRQPVASHRFWSGTGRTTGRRQRFGVSARRKTYPRMRTVESGQRRRTLDSIRRPAIVVSVMMPRNQKIDSSRMLNWKTLLCTEPATVVPTK